MKELLGGEGLHDFLEDRQRENRKTIDLATVLGGKLQQRADTFDVPLGLGGCRLREPAADMREIEPELLVVRVVERVRRPVEESLTGGGPDPVAQNRQNIDPETAILLGVEEVG